MDQVSRPTWPNVWNCSHLDPAPLTFAYVDCRRLGQPGYGEKLAGQFGRLVGQAPGPEVGEELGNGLA